MKTSSLQDIFNFRSVDPMLATSGQPSETDLAVVARAGFEVVVNLALHDDPRYSLPDERGVVESWGMEYVHIPVAFGAPKESDLLAFFGVLKARQSRKLFVHCAANMRVSAFLGLYKAIEQHEPDEHAFALMQTVWTPDPTWSAFIDSMLSKHRGG